MTSTPHASRRRSPTLLAEFLRWFIGLRWLAAAVAILAASLDWRLFHAYPHGGAKVAVGVGMLVYNAALWAILRHRPTGRVTSGETRPPTRRARFSGRVFLLTLAWLQIILDMIALALLALWTGGTQSPLLGLFALHMVFASLLLPRPMAYASAGMAMIIVFETLSLAHQYPTHNADRLLLLGWAATLCCTVFVGSQIARSLRRERRRLVRQTRKLLAVDTQLRRQQRAMAQHEKMVALGQMAAGVAHEIANPLASIDSLLQLMQRKPEKLKPESIQTLHEQTDRIARIVRELTTFARPADSAEQQTLPINDVVTEALGMLAFDPRMKATRLQKSFAPDTGVVPMLPQAIQQVLVNLLRNALDATERTPQPTLTLRTARHDGWVVIEIADNGPGITPKNLKHLFEPVFTTKPVGKGTGLGLSISYSLIARHGGSISVTSKPGEGATFRIKLPAEATPLPVPVTH
jgi:signal transduction histidine kinase